MCFSVQTIPLVIDWGGCAAMMMSLRKEGMHGRTRAGLNTYFSIHQLKNQDTSHAEVMCSSSLPSQLPICTHLSKLHRSHVVLLNIMGVVTRDRLVRKHEKHGLQFSCGGRQKIRGESMRKIPRKAGEKRRPGNKKSRPTALSSQAVMLALRTNTSGRSRRDRVQRFIWYP